MYNQTSDTFKEKMANSDLIMNNDNDVQMVKGLMLLDIISGLTGQSYGALDMLHS